MASLRFNQGDSVSLEEVITGLTSLSGYSAKLYIYDEDGDVYATADGSIDTLTITYEMLNEITKAFTVGTYTFETKIWDSSDHVFTPSEGTLFIDAPLVSDPS